MKVKFQIPCRQEMSYSKPMASQGVPARLERSAGFLLLRKRPPAGMAMFRSRARAKRRRMFCRVVLAVLWSLGKATLVAGRHVDEEG